MESLYKLKNHILGFDKENAFFTFFKDEEVEKIYFDNRERKAHFEFKLENEIYTNFNLEVEKINYHPEGLAVQIIFKDLKGRFKIKETYKYIDKRTILKNYTLSLKRKMNLNYFKIIQTGIKIEEDSEIYNVLDDKFSYKFGDEKVFKKAPLESSGIFLIKNKKFNDNLSLWYFGEENLPEIKHQDIIYTLILNKDLEENQEFNLGNLYLRFYPGNYLESIEFIEKFLRNPDRLDDSKTNFSEKGIANYINKKTFYNYAYSDTLYSLYRNLISVSDFKEWLKMEKAIIPSNLKIFYGAEGKNYKFYPEKIKYNFFALSLLLGDVLEKKYPQNYIDLIDLKTTNEVLNSGRNDFDSVITDDEYTLSFIKKYKESFYLCIFNFENESKNIKLTFNEKFLNNNLRHNKYKLLDVLSNKVYKYVNNLDNCKVELGKYEFKVFKFLNLDSFILEGNELKIQNEENTIFVKNNFYSLIFSKLYPGVQSVKTNSSIKSIISDIKIKNFNKKFDLKLKKDSILYSFEEMNLKYTFSKKNLISLELDIFNKKEKNDFYIEINLEDIENIIINNSLIKGQVELSTFEEILYNSKSSLKIQKFENNFEKYKIIINKNKFYIKTKLNLIKDYKLKIDLYIL